MRIVCIPPEGFYIIGKCEALSYDIKTEKPVSFDFSVERDEHITRGSTLFGADMHPLHLMITESPCRIRAAQRWSSDNNPAGCLHLSIPLWSHLTAYSSLQRFLPVIITLQNALSSWKFGNRQQCSDYCYKEYRNNYHWGCSGFRRSHMVLYLCDQERAGLQRLYHFFVCQCGNIRKDGRKGCGGCFQSGV